MRPDDADTASVAAPPPLPKRAVPVFPRGTIVGRYVILDRIGHGGMGVVYRAYDPDLDRRVALKLVRAVTEDATARLVREAKALAKVSHPNIVQIFDVGVFGTSVFIAMELVEGRTLSQWRRQAEPGWRDVLVHLIEAGRGLAAAHAAGLVHRDFKPSNAIVGADGRVRVLDFGVARSAVPTTDAPSDAPIGDAGDSEPDDEEEAVDEEAETGVHMSDESVAASDAPTQATRPPAAGARSMAGLAEPSGATALPRFVVSRITGTWVYMAPEQRKRGVLDARADQFAFAVSGWELLHGQRTFVGNNLREYAASSAAGKLRPPPPGNQTPAWVRRVLIKALSADPANRYPSMDELLAALEADPARRRKRLGAIALGATTVAAIAVAIATRATSASAPAPCEDAADQLAGVWNPAVAEKIDTAFRATHASFAPATSATVRGAFDHRAGAWIAMHTEACRATHISGDQSPALLDLRMSCLDRRREEMRALIAQLVTAPDAARVATAGEAVQRLPPIAACADRDALKAVVPMPAAPAERGAIEAARIELATTNALLLTGQWPEALRRAQALHAKAKQLGWAPLIAEAGLLRAQVERNTGSLPVAESVLGETVQAAARAHLDDVGTKAWAELAWVVGYEEERPLEGLALANAAEAIAERADAPPADLAGVAHTRALIWSAKGDQPAALAEAERALKIMTALPDADPLEIADIQNTIGMVRTAQGDYARAEQAHRDVLARRKAALGEGHPKVADSIDNLGVDRFHQGAYEEAKRDYEQALAIRIAALGPTNRDVGTSHNNLGGLLMETGDDRGAAEHLEAALHIYEGTLGKDHADLAIPLSNLGELATRRGDFDRAIEYCRRALALDEATTPDDPQLAYDLVCVGEAQLGKGDTAGARTTLERAIGLREGSEGDAGELARTRFDLARVLWRTGDRERARALAVKARDGFAAAGDAWKKRHADSVAWLLQPS